jgi:hypothetical protein
LHQSAVSDREGKARLYTHANAIQNNSLYFESATQEWLEVRTLSLDNVIGLTRLDVVKIDAEGAEPLILRGMRSLVDKNPEIELFMEFSKTNLQRAGVNPKEWIEEIRSDGWAVRQVREPDGEIIPISDQELSGVTSLNLSLIRNKK